MKQNKNWFVHAAGWWKNKDSSFLPSPSLGKWLVKTWRYQLSQSHKIPPQGAGNIRMHVDCLSLLPNWVIGSSLSLDACSSYCITQPTQSHNFPYFITVFLLKSVRTHMVYLFLNTNAMRCPPGDNIFVVTLMDMCKKNSSLSVYANKWLKSRAEGQHV